VQKAHSDLADALESYRRSLAIRQWLAQSDRNNAGWQDDLALANENVGDVLRARTALPTPSNHIRDELVILQGLTKGTPTTRTGNKTSTCDQQDRRVGLLSGLARDFATALQASDQAYRSRRSNLALHQPAHALMFLNRTDEARALSEISGLKSRAGRQALADRDPR